MNGAKEILPYVSLLTAIVSSVLAVVLAIGSRNLVGKGWLVASVVITLLTSPGFCIISFLAAHSSNREQIYHWYDVLNVMVLFGTACFGLFLLSNWSKSRMKLDVKHLLFSFSGRIPRSVFWISVCILFPVGTILGFAPYTTSARGRSENDYWDYLCELVNSEHVDFSGHLCQAVARLFQVRLDVACRAHSLHRGVLVVRLPGTGPRNPRRQPIWR